MFLVVCDQTGWYLALDSDQGGGWRWVDDVGAATWFLQEHVAQKWAARVTGEFVFLTGRQPA